jgi:hypothetical protein
MYLANLEISGRCVCTYVHLQTNAIFGILLLIENDSSVLLDGLGVSEVL